jgi:gliding motility-associated-like protein
MLWATHYRAGEITYKQVGPLTYEITVFTYTDPANTAADRQEIEVVFGDGKSEIVSRSNGNGEIVNSDINNTIKRNIYRTTHTFPGPFNYLINITDPNRVDNIKNINGGRSVNVPFYVESLLSIKEGFGNNQSPILLLPPIDVGCVNQTFTHNPIAYDPDGDSLAFTIIAPKEAIGKEVPNFSIPLHSDSFSIDINTGQLTWQKPMEAGTYNWAILIREFRGGKLIGYIVRDMQVYINNNCDNSPPTIVKEADICVEANQLITEVIRATDPNPGQLIKLQYYGGPFVQKNSPATMTPKDPIGPYTGVTGTFNWRPSCNAIRYRSHEVGFRAVDDHPTKALSHIINWNIKVVGPSPKNVQITQDSNGFLLTWNRDTCNLALGYKIYRKVDSSYWKHGPCETGVPSYTGFTLLDTTQGLNNSRYFDNNNGKGISPLIRYCYIISSQYYPRNEDGTIILIGELTESYASIEVCDIILKTKPIITKVSVEKTGTTDGKVEINWIKPEIFDTAQNKAPYKVELYRSTSALGNYQLVGSAINYPDISFMKNEVVIDSNLNTTDQTYFYKVQLFATKSNQYRLSEESTVAGSVRLGNYNTDKSIILKWQAEVPWINTETKILKKNSSNNFDSIATVFTNTFKDTGLANGQTYCYIVETKGRYDTNYYAAPIFNKSQEICGEPIDTIRPCVPELTIDTPCNSFSQLQVKLNWIYPSFCEQDVIRYRIYWRKNSTEKWLILDSVPFGINNYVDEREQLKFSIAGCYAVSAIDSFLNESYLWNAKCIDNCPFYTIPNVFTPNGDNKNDVLHPFPYRFIDKVDFYLYNRWGQEVFHSNDIDINWNGKDQKSGVDCVEGVYYYIAEVYESYLEGSKKRTLRGTITLIK